MPEPSGDEGRRLHCLYTAIVYGFLGISLIAFAVAMGIAGKRLAGVGVMGSLGFGTLWFASICYRESHRHHTDQPDVPHE